MNVLQVNGKKSFSAHFDPEKNIGTIGTALRWANYAPPMSKGFSLNNASRKMFEPALPSGCELESLRGSLSWQAWNVSPLSIQLKGASCEPFIAGIGLRPFVMIFSDVPHLVDGESTPWLRLEVLHSASEVL